MHHRTAAPRKISPKMDNFLAKSKVPKFIQEVAETGTDLKLGKKQKKLSKD